jgi:hypothetical protein
MSVARVTQSRHSLPKSFDEALEVGVKRANTLRNRVDHGSNNRRSWSKTASSRSTQSI